jgi:putative aminopeptidase FrvX
MNKESEGLLKELTEAAGVSGYEREVSEIIERHLKPICSISYDKLGSIICRKVGTAESPRIMLCGHMDEVGFMVRRVTDKGFVRFLPLGGWWDQVLLAQQVAIKTHKGDVTGIVGSKPPHALEPEERTKVVKQKNMFIDVGASSRADAEKRLGVRPGDPVIPVCPFTPMNRGKTFMAKAWDDRVGCGMFVDVIKKLAKRKHPNAVYGVGSVQEEVGLRGARTSVTLVKPDAALVMEVGLATDTPDVRPDDVEGRLGKGPQIGILDSSMIPNLKLRDLAIATAEQLKIPYQLQALTRGGQDGGQIHVYAEGVPCVYVGVPTRYIHSHAGIIHGKDYENAVKLVEAVVKKLDGKTVRNLTR